MIFWLTERSFILATIVPYLKKLVDPAMLCVGHNLQWDLKVPVNLTFALGFTRALKVIDNNLNQKLRYVLDLFDSSWPPWWW